MTSGRFRRTAWLEWIASGAEEMTDKETFRHVIGNFASGVTVLTARHGGADFGATASAVSSLSARPDHLDEMSDDGGS